MACTHQQYEASHMVPAQSNYETARHTLNELLAAAPKAFGLKDFAERLAICLMEDNVREAMMSVQCNHSAFKLLIFCRRLPQQPWLYRATLELIMKSIAALQGWFLFPRRAARFTVDTSIVTDPIPGMLCPRLHPRK
jgi:hypothetical protein